MTRHALVLNQYALPRSEPGGTRHVDLFSRLHPAWTSTIIAGNRNHYSQERYATADPGFVTVRVPKMTGTPTSRLATWLTYSAGAARASLKCRRPDLVFASSPHLLTPLCGIFLSRLFRVPLVIEIRDLWPESFVAAGAIRRDSLMYRILRILETIAARAADTIVTVTEGWEDHFSDLGVQPELIHVIPNGSEPADFHTSEDARAKTRGEQALSGVTAVFAGAHGPKDGLLEILDAAATLPEITFLLIGDGADKLDTKEDAKQRGLNNVRFLDPVSKEDLPAVLASCDIGIHSVTPLPVFDLGMSPNKLFDYLAAGLPVASNAGRPIKRIAEDCEAIVAGDRSSLGEGISRIAAQLPAKRHEFRQSALALMHEKFSRTRSAAKLMTALDQTVSDTDRRRSKLPFSRRGA